MRDFFSFRIQSFIIETTKPFLPPCPIVQIKKKDADFKNRHPPLSGLLSGIDQIQYSFFEIQILFIDMYTAGSGINSIFNEIQIQFLDDSARAA